jgi:hypothetical protein
MVIKINYTSSDVYVSTSVSPVYVVVNYSGTSTGGGVWGQITGTLSNQTDLQTALDDKVPYTGATANVDLGGFSIKPSMVQITGINSGGTGGVLNIKKGNTRVIGGDDVANNISLWAETGAFGFNDWVSGNLRNAKFSLLSITNNATRTYTLPDLSGTLALLSDIPSLTGFVPYTGATTNVDLGTHRILAQNATIASNGSGDTFTLNHTSGSGIGLNITKGGNGEGLYINKTSGSGNAATIIGTLNATTLVKSGGTSSQFLKADGSVDSTTYVGGSGATGQVAYWNGTSSQTGSNNLFWDAANSRLGIGTNAPSTMLHLSGANANIRISRTGTVNDESSLILNNTANTAGGQIRALMGSGGMRFMNFSAVTEYARFTASDNFHIGAFTSDSGQRLQVQGDAYIKGSGATSATNALLVQNSATTELLKVDNSGQVFVPNRILTARVQTSSSGSLLEVVGGIGSATGGTGTILGQFTNVTNTSGTYDRILASGSFLPTSGTGTFRMLNLEGVINQTGGANGITRGLYVAPTLTAAADWRSIEWSNNSGWGLYGAGSADNYLRGKLLINTTTVGTFDLDVNGTARVTGASTFGGKLFIGTTSVYLDFNSGSLDIATGGATKLNIASTGAATFSSSVTATSFIKSGGTSSQYLMADGSVTTGSALTITNRQTASYTLVLADADKLVEMNVATANNLTVPLNSSVAFPIGTKIDLAQYGAGQTTVVATSGVTVRSVGGALKLAVQYSGATLVKIGTDEWYLFGDITV